MDFVEKFGLTVDEIRELTSIAENAVDADPAVLARTILDHVSPATSQRIRRALVASSFKTLSEAGYMSVVQLSRDSPEEFQAPEELLKQILVNPAMHRSVATWCLYFALRDCSDNFQLNHCPSPTEEGQLTGMLQGEICAQCKVWRKRAAGPLDRLDTTLTLKRIDLSILEGEQETGGDFGLVLEFDEKGNRSPTAGESVDSRIVPLIFQAKRYVRPRADVSQRHNVRGYQYDLLSQNPCLSAYIFYENGTGRIDTPVPPLIKPVSKVSLPPSRTMVFEGSLDLPTYFLRALYDESFAAGASSPAEALRMIYGSAHAGQLATLAVISNSATAGERYTSELADFREEIRTLQDTEHYEDPLTN